jgi:hypothetical protein
VPEQEPNKPPPRRSAAILTLLANQALLVAIAFAGGALFHLLQFPAPWVSGSMVAVGAAAMLFRLPKMAPQMKDLALLAAGIAIGASVTPETVRVMVAFPSSIAVLCMTIVLGTFLSAQILSRFFGWRWEDAVLAGVPGALSSVLAVAAERRCDIVGIAVVQNIRLVVLVVVLPSFVSLLENAPSLPLAAGSIIAARDLLLIAIVSIWAGGLFERVGAPAGLLFGGMIITSIAMGSGLSNGSLPDPLAIAGFTLVGVFTGSRLDAISRATFARYAIAGLATLASSVLVATAGALSVAALLGVRLGSVLLAFAPGGVEAMALLSLSFNLDPLFVSAHHILRFMAIAIFLPVVLSLRTSD